MIILKTKKIMEPRKVTIIDNRSQSQNVINNSTATTIGELKEEMNRAGIVYEGMTFYEGHIRAELKDDASILPTNISYKGQIVNDLIFLLTTPDKKIKSGIITRAEIYAIIKEKGLQDQCIAKFGKNFTQCSTVDLMGLLNSPKLATETVVKKSEVTPKTLIKKEENTTASNEIETEFDPQTKKDKVDVIGAINILIEELYDEGCINYAVYSEIKDKLNGNAQKGNSRTYSGRSSRYV